MRRINLVHGPTPLVKYPALDDLFGIDLWVKRDDATGGAEAGNKVRKLEFLLAHAIDERATHIITCGGLQSNHARATAIVCAQLGLVCTLLLRVADPPENGLSGPESDAPKSALGVDGNVLLNRMVGAHIRLITPRDYVDRNACMEKVAAELRARGERPYIIPEGGSNGLGTLGYVEAMREVRLQVDLGLGGGEAFDLIVHACGSGGTAAGVAIGIAAAELASEVRAFAVCDDRAYFERTITRLIDETRAFDPLLPAAGKFVVDDAAKGPRYGKMSVDQQNFLIEIARKSGLIADPVYTGKALFGLREAIKRGEIAQDSRVLYIHTGGLPGLLADGETLRALL